jgi:hypothetical protein
VLHGQDLVALFLRELCEDRLGRGLLVTHIDDAKLQIGGSRGERSEYRWQRGKGWGGCSWTSFSP